MSAAPPLRLPKPSNRYLTAGTLLLISLLVACARPQPTLPPPADAPASFPAQDYEQLPTNEVLSVSAAQLQVRAYRSGRLRRLGHSHVISSTDVQGYAHAPKNLASGRADLYLPLHSFVVDDPQLRLAAGAEFASEPSAEDRNGTRRNMLGAKLLNAAEHPFVSLGITPESITRSGSNMTGRARVTVDIAGMSQILENIPFALAPSPDNGWLLDTEFSLQHSALGLTPFSALGGALSVAPELQIQLQLRLHRL